MKKIGLGRKLMFGGAIIVSLPMLVLSLFLILKSTSTLTDFSQNTTLQTVDKLTTMVRTVIDKEVAQVRGLSASSRIAEISAKAKMNGRESVKEEGKALNNEFRNVLKQLGDQYSGMFVSDTNGLTLAGIASNGDTKAYETMDIADREYFKEVKKGGKADVASIAKSKATNQPVMVVYSPIRSETGDFLGILCLTSKVDLLVNLVADTKVGVTGYAFMLDEKGFIIAHPRRELILDLNVSTTTGTEELGRDMTGQKRGIILYSFEGKEKIGAFAPVGVRGWSIGVIEPKEELLSQVNAFRNQGIIIGVALLGFALTVILFFGRSISKPITRIVEGLSENGDQVSAASGQISSSSQQLAEGASEQAASIEETSASLEEMSSMTRQNAENARQADQLMANTKGSVSRSSQMMNELTTSMGEISAASEETSKIIKTIDEIAFQTNLLALNAAVEAARAGEAGAGFAVVADEVRNLAMRAAEAAKNTANLIEGTVRRVKDGSELVGKTEKEFREVAINVERSSELVGQISVASQEQAQGIEQVSKAVSEMDKVVQQNAANAEESASASEEMNFQADRLKEYVGELQSLVGGAESSDSVDSSEQANETGKNLSRTYPAPEIKANGHSKRGKGKDLSSFSKIETRSEHKTTSNEADF
ncbi:MAG: methyl-accepting chemotaxis protein [Syntrophobacteraceae bacterium]